MARIYDCAIYPDDWDKTLGSINTTFRGASSALGLIDRHQGKMLVRKYVGIEDPSLRELQAKHSPEILQMLSRFALQTAPDEPHVASRLPQGYRLPFFSGELKPRGFVDVMTCFLSDTPAHLSYLGIGRQDDQGVFTNREVVLGGLLLPHLRRAVTINRLLDACAVEKARLAETLDSLTCGVVIANRRRAILHANRAAERMMRHGRPIVDVHGVLKANAPAADGELKTAMSLAAANETSLGKRGLAIRLTSNDEPAQYAHVLPLTGGEVRPRLEPDAAAAIFVGAAVDKADGAGTMAAAFSLTSAESRALSKNSFLDVLLRNWRPRLGSQ